MAKLSADKKKLLGNYDRYTGVSFNATIYSSLPAGIKVDNAIWFKNRDEFGGGYAKRDFEGNIMSSWLGLAKDGSKDVAVELEYFIKIANVELESGDYLCSPFRITKNLLIGHANSRLISNGGDDSLMVDCDDGGGISGSLHIDGDMKSSKGVAIRQGGIISATGKFKFTNFRGVELDSYGLRIYSSLIDKVVSINDAVFEDIAATEDGEVGNLKGAARGLVLGGGKLKWRVNNCSFDRVGTFEDGDQIVVATEEVSGGTWTYADGIIDGCTFNNVMKRAIKVMASGVRVFNCNANSQYTEADKCPQAAFEAYGDDVVMSFNKIRFTRALAGISYRDTRNTDVSYNDLEVDEFGVYAASLTRGATAYAIRVYLTGTTTLLRASGTMFSNRINSTSSILLQQVEGLEINQNRIWGNINISTQSDSVNIMRNVFFPIKRTNQPLNRILIAGMDVKNISVEHNIFSGGRIGVGLGSVAFPVANNWRVANNEYYGMTVGNVVSNLTDETTLYLDKDPLNFDVTGTVYSSSSSFDVNSVPKDGIYIASASLVNLPSTNVIGGGNWWRVEQKSTYVKPAGDDKIQYATLINSPQLSGKPFIQYIRHRRDSVWGEWDRVLTQSFYGKSATLTTANVQIDNSRMMTRSIGVDSSISFDAASIVRGGECVIQVNNTDSVDHIMTFNQSTVTRAFSVPRNGSVTFSCMAINGVLKVYKLSEGISVLEDRTSSFSMTESFDRTATQFTSASNGTATVLSGLRVGFSCIIKQNGTGQLTIVGGAGVTIDSIGGLNKTSEKGAIVTMYVLSPGVVTLSGSLS